MALPAEYSAVTVAGTYTTLDGTAAQGSVTPGVEELREQLDGPLLGAPVGLSLVADGHVVHADGSVDGDES